MPFPCFQPAKTPAKPAFKTAEVFPPKFRFGDGPKEDELKYVWDYEGAIEIQTPNDGFKLPLAVFNIDEQSPDLNGLS